MKVESKDEYKSRNQKSPDDADACIMIPQLIRLRGDVLPGMVEQYDARKRNPMYGERVDNLETADEEDSVCADGSGSV
jgi:hypothetical protein